MKHLCEFYNHSRNFLSDHIEWSWTWNWINDRVIMLYEREIQNNTKSLALSFFIYTIYKYNWLNITWNNRVNMFTKWNMVQQYLQTLTSSKGKVKLDSEIICLHSSHNGSFNRRSVSSLYVLTPYSSSFSCRDMSTSCVILQKVRNVPNVLDRNILNYTDPQHWLLDNCKNLALNINIYIKILNFCETVAHKSVTIEKL